MRADLSLFREKDISRLRNLDALVSSARNGHPSRFGSEYLWHTEQLYDYFRKYIRSRRPEQETFYVGDTLQSFRSYLEKCGYVTLEDFYYWSVIDYYCGSGYHADALNWKYFRATIDTRGCREWSDFMRAWEDIVDPYSHRDYTILDTRALALHSLYESGRFFCIDAIRQVWTIN